MNDASEIAQLIASRVKGAISKALAGITNRIDAIQERLAALENRPLPRDGKDGRDGRDGKDAEPISPAKLAETVQEAVASYLADHPPAPGRDGAPASAEMVSAAVSEYLEAHPPKDGVTPSEDDIARAVAGYLALHPIRDGRDGRDGKDGKDGKDGEKGLDGKDGKDGRDGMGFDDLDISFDLDKRTFTFMLTRGEYTKTIEVKARGIPVQRGVFRRNEKYEHGDIVTWDGSQWFATKDTELQPKVGNDWQLIVKRGQDGKEGPPGKAGKDGLNGRDGRDLTHIAPDGSRY